MVATLHAPAPLPRDQAPPFIDYPDSDGKPMAETDDHYRALTGVRYELEQHLGATGRVAYVGANIFLYYREGDPKRSVSPDVFVALDVQPGRRRTYKLWEEGKMPEVVFEMTSLSTRQEDLGTKLELYQRLGVQEYFLFDPWREHLENPLRTFRRIGSDLIPVVESPVRCLVLDLELHVVDRVLRLKVPGAAGFLLTPEEVSLRAEAESRRADAEAAARKVEFERAEAESRRAEAQSQRAEAQSQRADQQAAARRAESRRADAEAAARLSLEAQLARLQAELEARRVQ